MYWLFIKTNKAFEGITYGFVHFTSIIRGSRGLDHMVVGFTTTYVISAYHHWCCKFESRSERGVQHYVIKFVSDLRQVGGFFQVLQFPPPIKLTPRYSWNIVESDVKHHQTNKQTSIIWSPLSMLLCPDLSSTHVHIWFSLNK